MYNGRPAPERGWEPDFEPAAVARTNKRSSREVFCAGCEREAKGFPAAKAASAERRRLFNKIQVTCVGALVGEFANDESDHALIVIRSKERLSAKSTRRWASARSQKL